ncbi:MAG: anti-sigma F factor [Clostridia bacterium]|nr:anti-sigma F factor [Clostridia bacterium]
MKTDNCIKIEFLSKSCNEGFSRIAVAALAAQLDPTLEQISEIKTAVSEAVTNSIVHGYGDFIGKIYITAKLTGNKLTVIIRDKGRGIENIEKAREPMFTTGDKNERSGMGFTIMEAFMDSVKIRSVPGKGTKVTLIKTLESKR